MTVLVLVSLGAMVLASVRPGAPPPPPPAGGPLADELGHDVRAVVVAPDVVDALELDADAASAPPSSAAMASVVPTLRGFLPVMIDSFSERQVDVPYPVRCPPYPLSGYAAIS